MQRLLTRIAPLALCVSPLVAQDAAPSPADELVRREYIRSEVEAAFERVRLPAANADEYIDNATAAAEGLLPIAEEASEFFAVEIEQELPLTFDFCAYTLGRFGTPAAEAALRRVSARTEEDDGDFARMRKAWTAWALGLQGKPDAVDMINNGKHQVARYTMHADTSVMEAVAVLTAPDCVPRLIRQIEASLDDEALASDLRFTLRALRRVGDPAAVPALIELLDHENRNVRREAARTLRSVNTPQAVRALLDALGDPDATVRQAAAVALEDIRPTGHTAALVERLETDQDSVARGLIYRLIARVAGAEAAEILSGYWGRPDSTDRRYLVEAIALTDGPQTLATLKLAMQDESNTVAIRAAMGLNRLGTPEAVAVLGATLAGDNPATAQTIALQLQRLGATEAAPAIAARLRREIAVPIDRRHLAMVEYLGDALVGLGDFSALEMLPAGIELQSDPIARTMLEQLAVRMQLLKDNRDSARKWIKTLAADDDRIRALAYARLGEIGGRAAVGALVEGFESAQPADRVEILRALGEVDDERAARLIENVLLSPEFDPVARLPQREMAAWSARRIGGDTMYAALVSAVERRRGRDAKITTYAALLGGARALPLLEAHRKTHMQYFGWNRGHEQNGLAWLARRIASGEIPVEYDLPPDRLSFRVR